MNGGQIRGSGCPLCVFIHTNGFRCNRCPLFSYWGHLGCVTGETTYTKWGTSSDPVVRRLMANRIAKACSRRLTQLREENSGTNKTD